MTKKMVQQFCTSVNGIIVPTKPIIDNLQQWQIHTPLAIIPSPLDDNFFQKKPEIKKKNNQFKLLVVSRFVKEKNLTFLLDVMRTLSDQFSLTLVGYGSEYESLQKYAYQYLGLSTHRVYFIYKPTKEKLIDFYQNADVFIFSSQIDTQGLVLAEAMACGTPVVAVDGPGQQDIVKNNYNGFIVNSVEEMRKKIVQISQNVLLHGQLQQGAWQTAQKYQSRFIIEEMLKFYGTIKGYNDC
jgi:glycosyltransferase involved in cell wall biosynthesis